jgi:hypothetical protein
VALLDKNGTMCAFGDVGPEYNCLPLAVTNVAGTQDAASADQYATSLFYCRNAVVECLFWARRPEKCSHVVITTAVDRGATGSVGSCPSL